MPNYIIYQAISTDEINECSYSLLKYLDLYNLKPPPDHSVVIYSGKPALLEAYGSFLNSFELKEIKEKEQGTREKETRSSKASTLKALLDTYKGNMLYLPSNAYPIKQLDSLFSAINRGAIYGSTQSLINQTPHANLNLPIIGFNSQQHAIDMVLQRGQTQPIGQFIEQYRDLKEFRTLLRDFFRRYQEESIPNQVKLMHSINARQIQDQKNQFKKLPLLTRMMRTMMGKGWDITKHSGRI
ncbi:MAG: hypothetical protein ACJ749_08910 [Flavisolibacter sp.]